MRNQSFGGPIAPRGDLRSDLLLISAITAKAMFSRAVCCALCNLSEACEATTQELSSRLPLPLPSQQKPRAPQMPSHEVLAILQAAFVDGGTDLLLNEFAQAVEQQLYPLDALGAWTTIAKREVTINLQVLMQSEAVLGAGEAPRLRDVLAAEAAAGLHSTDASGVTVCPGGSAALALVWLSRFLGIWVDQWREPRAPTFKESVMRAYASRIAPYHTWLLRKAFKVATALVPTWGEAHDQLAACDDEGEAGVLRCVAVLEPILELIEALLLEHGLWDTCRV